jgi:hypothetical protein
LKFRIQFCEDFGGFNSLRMSHSETKVEAK